RQFNVKIEHPSLSGHEFTGSFRADAPIDTILTQVTRTVKLDFEYAEPDLIRFVQPKPKKPSGK
ncbi:MAG: DUF4974 domain-containing protein, partial [Bacteroidota bacterium]